eukprot:CAMPEP_0114229344 /NCGR_PEP_ID=MMETSP0058-20121206/2854_1 /TAXON_ID=36894 /ORGANISM="Pyramimonas parkeae, CCMP726" /LENGTH=477 /DNA_ID=CAMNT_0001340407 /DNA_START=53 /DNA_END=1486 /DNA_ORIENTATION=+
MKGGGCLRVLEHEVVIRPCGTQAVITVQGLPAGVKASDVTLDLLGESTMELKVLEAETLTLSLPFPVLEEGCRVKLRNKPASLRISVQAAPTEVQTIKDALQESITAAARVVSQGGIMGCIQPEADGIGRGADASESVANALNQRGWAVVDNFLQSHEIDAAYTEIHRLQDAGQYEPGRIGTQARYDGQMQMTAARGDEVLWMDADRRRTCPGVNLIINAIDQFVTNGLKAKADRLSQQEGRTDAMLACYPGGGARYTKHVDNTFKDGRRLSVVCYLNPGWKAEHGGTLQMHPMATGLLSAARGQSLPHHSSGEVEHSVEVLPLAGRVALFYADTVLHEVTPATAPRHALTMWFYDGPERRAALAKTDDQNIVEVDLPNTMSTEGQSKEMETALMHVLAVLQSLAQQDTSTATQEHVQQFVGIVKNLRPRAQEIMAWLLEMKGSDDLLAKIDSLTLSSYKTFLAGAAKAATTGMLSS